MFNISLVIFSLKYFLIIFHLNSTVNHFLFPLPDLHRFGVARLPLVPDAPSGDYFYSPLCDENVTEQWYWGGMWELWVVLFSSLCQFFNSMLTEGTPGGFSSAPTPVWCLVCRKETQSGKPHNFAQQSSADFGIFQLLIVWLAHKLFQIWAAFNLCIVFVIPASKSVCLL